MSINDRKVTLEIPANLVLDLVDAINCYTDCIEGNRGAVEEIWFVEDDQTLTGGSFLAITQELQEQVAEPLREEVKHLMASDPEFQDFLHRLKMMRKHGTKETE